MISIFTKLGKDVEGLAQITAIGIQDFEKIRTENIFYVDKTHFIKEWWERKDDVTLITRPRRFGKTLNMSMLECFFSVKYAGRADLFEGLSVWKEEAYRAIQGTYPVIALSFANVKGNDFAAACSAISMIFMRLYSQHSYLLESDRLLQGEKELVARYLKYDENMHSSLLKTALQTLSVCMEKHFGQKPLIFLDEYDTPMQEAWVNGYWNELVSLFRELFNNTFKTNRSISRAVLTGITRVSKESLFSDLNNLKIVTTTSDEYKTAFGFTESEVFEALDERGFSDQKAEVRAWYDGFTFGNSTDIYNPWSIINYLDQGKLTAYWVNTSSNALAGKLIREGSPKVKEMMWDLLKGIPLVSEIDEQIVFNRLDGDENAIWSLFLASGYLKVDECHWDEEGRGEYTLSLTNYEVKLMFEKLILDWFHDTGSSQEYNGFVKSLLKGDVEAMNYYMSDVAAALFSSFDTGNHPSEKSQPERFYHGFVLGLVVDLKKRYVITSNRESGFGRYDVMLEPLQEADPAIVMEFKVRNPLKEKSLDDTVSTALRQIEEKDYDRVLAERGIVRERIRHYGFGFEGKRVVIGG